MVKDNTLKIGELVKKALKSAGIAERVEKQQAIVFWPEIVGPEIAQKTSAIRIEKDILIVKVVSATWRNELVFFKKEILKKIGKRIGNGKIKDIYFC